MTLDFYTMRADNTVIRNSWWVNFSNAYTDVYTISDIRNLLVEFNAIMHSDRGTDYYIEFSSEEDYTMFLLRFG